MKNEDLLEEIRLNRKAIEEVRKELYIFKRRSLGFISVLSFIASFIMDFLKTK